jgi:hypothetical protein
VVPPDMPPEECGVPTFRERPRQNRTAPELGIQLSTRMWRDRRLTLKLCAGTVFCFICVGVVAAVVHIHPAEQDIVASNTAPATDSSPRVSADGSLTTWTALPQANVAPLPESQPKEPISLPAEPAPTAAVASAAPTPDVALTIKMPALPSSPAALRPTTEVAAPTETRETKVSTAIPPAASPTGAALRAPTVSPTESQTPESTPLAPGPPPAQLRLSAAEIAMLLARGDTLLVQGDISSARLFYERAADAGDGRAALRLGNTFDPNFLDLAHLHVRGDSAIAESWYSRARELGETKAQILLKRSEPVIPR